MNKIWQFVYLFFGGIALILGMFLIFLKLYLNMTSKLTLDDITDFVPMGYIIVYSLEFILIAFGSACLLNYFYQVRRNLFNKIAIFIGIVFAIYFYNIFYYIYFYLSPYNHFNGINCSNIGSKYQSQRDSCFGNEAQRTKNIEICNQISYEHFKRRCIVELTK